MVPDTLSFMAAAMYKEKIWCSNLNFNGLFTINIADGKIDYIGRFAGHNDMSVGLHRIAEPYKSKLFFFPNYSGSIDSYDDFTGTFHSCRIHAWEKEKKANTFTCTSGTYLWKEIYYIFPRFSRMKLIKFSPDENQILEEIELKLANELAASSEETMSFNCTRACNDIYIPICGTNHVVKFNLETESEYRIDLPETDRISGRMDFDGNSFWLNSDDKIKRYDSTLKRMISSYSCVMKNEGIITKFIFKDNLVFALPAYLGTIKVIDVMQNSIQEIGINMANMKLQLGPIAKWRHTESCIYFDNYFMTNPIGINSGLLIDYHTFKETAKRFEAPFESMPIKNYGEKINYEYRKNDLEDFIYFVMHHKGTYAGKELIEESRNA